MAVDNYQEETRESDNPGGSGEPQESRLKRGMDIFGSLFALNICFVISCIPLITIGAAFTALYAMMFRIQRRDDYTVVKEYFSEFRTNFKRGTGAWLIMLLICVLLWGQYTYVCNFEGGLADFYSIALVVEGIVFVLIIPFVFPLLAYFDNTVGNTFQNAFFLAVSNLGAWIKMSVAWFATVALCFGYEAIILNTWYLWMLLIFALLAYGTSLTAKKVFDRVAVAQKEKEEQEKAKEEAKASETPKRSIKEKGMLAAFAAGETETDKQTSSVPKEEEDNESDSTPEEENETEPLNKL